MLFLLVLILLSFTPSATFAAWDGKVVDLYDGDTLIISDDGRARIIRLFGVDCPEKDQPFGLKAKCYSSKIASGKEIHIVTVDKKRYPRCIVYVEDRCLNEELLKAGYAWHDKNCSSDEKWSQMEKKAIDLRNGLWSQEDPVPPWEFREEKEPKNTARQSHTIKLGGKHQTGRVPAYRPRIRHKKRR